jgi:hypothetical protein
MEPTAMGRGLVLETPVTKQCIVSVPLENTLLITDDNTSISVLGDRALTGRRCIDLCARR